VPPFFARSAAARVSAFTADVGVLVGLGAVFTAAVRFDLAAARPARAGTSTAVMGDGFAARGRRSPFGRGFAGGSAISLFGSSGSTCACQPQSSRMQRRMVPRR
jgi:hypothetical protein